MGLCLSAPPVNGIDEAAGKSRLEKSIANKLRQRHKTGQHKKMSWNKIILNFPHIEENFRLVRAAFEKFDQDKSGGIDRTEFSAAIQELGGEMSVDQRAELFAGLDGTHNGMLNYKEFLMCLAVGYVEGRFPTDGTVSAAKKVTFKETFELVRMTRVIDQQQCVH